LKTNNAKQLLAEKQSESGAKGQWNSSGILEVKKRPHF